MKKLWLLLLCAFSTQFLIAQCVDGNCQDGRGTYVYPSGARYVGQFKAGEIHGVGVCYYTDGSKYSGQWQHRYPEGKGTKTFADGNKWTGKWVKGQPVNKDGDIVDIGPKEETTDDGTNIQTGCITGDCENGQGVFAYADGSKYEGQFKVGKLDGWGTWFDISGDKYIGSFKDNFMHGSGALYAADGKITSGEWVEGEYMGDGRVAHGQQGCISGDCENGQGTYVYQDQAAKYVGAFKNGLADGKGICYYDNGDRYEGQWRTGSFNGNGTLFMEDGAEVKGFWKDGIYMGENAPATNTAELITEAVEDAGLINTDLNVYAVVIGISSYKHMPALRYTDDDAYRMYAFLKSPEGGALPDDNIRILVDEDATREHIVKNLHEVFGKAGPNDLVMLYFSGHGLKGSFLPIDFDGFNNKLLHEELNEIFDASEAKYKLCIADACHSGSLFAMKGNYESALNKYYQTLAQAKAGTALIMSSKSDETSLESSGLRQGVFSHFLIRGLKGEADLDKNRIINIQELYNYIAENVRSYTGLRQSPVIKGDYDPTMTVGVLR